MFGATIQAGDLTEAIRTAIAPVVLISGIGLLLLTLTGRLGRIVDRTRLTIRERLASPPERRTLLESQLRVLAQRARLIRLALALSVLSIVLTGVVVTTLFVSALVKLSLTVLVAVLFAASLISVVVAMLVFMRELQLSLIALEMEFPEKSP